MSFAETLFESVKGSPSRGNAFSGQRGKTADAIGPTAKGAWSQIRQRAEKIIGESDEFNYLEISSDYRFKVGDTDRDVHLYLGNGSYFPLKKTWLNLAVSVGIARSPSDLLDLAGSGLKLLNPSYGAIFRFPVAAGASTYLSGATYSGPTVRELGPPDDVLGPHADRVHRAKYRTSTEFSYGSGYVREVYEINILSEAHLCAPLLTSTVKAYAESIGNLQASSLWPDLFEWRLERDELDQARADWEHSGLVLSAECQPVRWQ
ncbi:hypothetical protein ATE48_00300 [Candidatus Viadribacter manganicus]|uniref:Uncharacterized protein n=1 Tax=Candidatus Viadribacter manganicus TaxID=1759059 RepID=A0A1B1AD38_9PROT|nr:hypothetical protein ATE48_00300 [Candidatus Viadribacter manganicus]